MLKDVVTVVVVNEHKVRKERAGSVLSEHWREFPAHGRRRAKEIRRHIIGERGGRIRVF